ncbi:MAG: hypothetical protein IJ711_04255 [Lachnospiraceae bacterium]|nr:hypothetical protein [Lachnospiraceae bacterium]
MIYDNYLYGLFNQYNIQEQLRQQQLQQHHTDQLQKSAKCAQKLDELLRCIDEVEPEYQRIAFEQCCVVIGNHMRQRGML